MAGAHFDRTDGPTGIERIRPGFPLTHCNKGGNSTPGGGSAAADRNRLRISGTGESRPGVRRVQPEGSQPENTTIRRTRPGAASG